MIEPMKARLAKHPFVAGLDPYNLEFLAGCASNARFYEGELLCREGEEADATYLIRSGRVSLEIQSPGRAPVTVQTLGPGDALGWSWMYAPYRWHFDARAIEAVSAIRLDGKCLRAKCEGDPAFGFEIARRFLRLVQRRLEATRMQVLDVYGDPS